MCARGIARTSRTGLPSHDRKKVEPVLSRKQIKLPGAMTLGLMRPSNVGPREENGAMLSTPCRSGCSFTAAESARHNGVRRSGTDTKNRCPHRPRGAVCSRTRRPSGKQPDTDSDKAVSQCKPGLRTHSLGGCRCCSSPGLARQAPSQPLWRSSARIVQHAALIG